MPRDVVYPPVIGAMRLAFGVMGLRLHLEGDEHIPPRGPVIVASNHVSYLDFAFVGLAARRSRRYIRFLTRYDVWHNPFAGPLMRGMHHIPVDRAAPAGAYLEARAALRHNEAIGVFPEAGVSKSLTVRTMMPGAVALARETGAPLVPMALWGGQRIYTASAATTGHQLHLQRGRPITIVVGEPMEVDGDSDVRAGTVLLAARLRSLVDHAQAIHPDRPATDQPAPWHPAHLGGTAPTPEQARLIEQIPRSAIDVL